MRNRKRICDHKAEACDREGLQGTEEVRDMTSWRSVFRLSPLETVVGVEMRDFYARLLSKACNIFVDFLTIDSRFFVNICTLNRAGFLRI